MFRILDGILVTTHDDINAVHCARLVDCFDLQVRACQQKDDASEGEGVDDGS